MNLGEIKTAVKAYGFSDTDPLVTWINEALHELEDYSNWPFLVTAAPVVTIANQPSVTLPTNLVKLHTARVSGETEDLEYLPTAMWEANIEDQTEVGVPTYYSIRFRSLLLWRVPDAAYSIMLTYKKRCDDLVDDADVPGIPDAHHYALVYGAAAIGLRVDGDTTTQAKNARDDFDTKLKSMIDLYFTLQSGQLDQVRDVMGYG